LLNWGTGGAVLAALAVLIGAFGAHALKERLDAYSTQIYERAVFYHFVHALGLIAIGLLVATHTAVGGAIDAAGWLLLAGIVIFSGSLYALALSGIKVLGAITPIGVRVVVRYDAALRRSAQASVSASIVRW
jgi:uncharacterized membrane protein YgdD (TMEM256/DUF423 family)